MKRSRNILLKLVPTFVIVGVFLLGFLGEPENSVWLNRSPAWGKGDPFQGNEGENMVANSMLVWRGQPHFSGDGPFPWAGVDNAATHNEHGLRDDPVRQKPEGTTRVLNIGDSSTWGLNLASRDETYTDQLEAMLEAADPGAYDVVNGGTVGYSSLQGLQFFRYAADDIDPDVLTVYLGNNDSAPSRVKDAARIVRYTPLRGWLSRNAFYLLLQKASLSLRSDAMEKSWEAWRSESASKEDSPAYQSVEAYYELRARVTPKEYGDNLRAIVNEARERGLRAILLKVPRNLLWPQVRTWGPSLMEPTGYWTAVQVEQGFLARAALGGPSGEKPLLGHPYLSLVTPEQFADLMAQIEQAEHGPAENRPPGVRISSSEEDLLRAVEDSSLSELERLRARHNYGVARFVAEDYAGARAAFESVLQAGEAGGDRPIETNLAKTQYMLGVTLLLERKRELAFETLNESRDRWPFAMSADYQDQFDAVVRELDAEWIDLPGLFEAEDPEFRGSALILDWVHPNARGGRLIAEAIAERLLQQP